MTLFNAYKALGTHRASLPEENKDAYIKKVLVAHPDKGGKAEDFATLGEALEFVTRKKASYDAMLSAYPVCDECGGYGFKDLMIGREPCSKCFGAGHLTT